MAEFLQIVRVDENDNFTIGVPFTKRKDEKGNLIIEGIVTAEVLDKQGDIVDYDAAKRALRAWPGNIREMHKNEACGFRLSQTFDDAKREAWLRAMVSKAGAPETWAKVDEGILTGYSIGGKLKEKVMEKQADGSQVRRLTGLDIHETSLVDNPALPCATFSIISKSADGEVLLGEGVELADDEFLAKTPGLIDAQVASESFGKRLAELQRETHDWRDDEIGKAEWSTAYKNDLADSAFAYVEEGEKDKDGKTTPREKRHYPLKDHNGKYDKAHVVNARARAAAQNDEKAMPKIKSAYAALALEWTENTEKAVASGAAEAEAAVPPFRQFNRRAHEVRRALKEGILKMGHWYVVSKEAAEAAEGGEDLIKTLAKVGSVEVKADEDVTADDIAAAIESAASKPEPEELAPIENMAKGPGYATDLADETAFELNEEDLAKALAPMLESRLAKQDEEIAKLTKAIEQLAGQPAAATPVTKEQPRTADADAAVADDRIAGIRKRMGNESATPEQVMGYGASIRKRQSEGEEVTFQEREDANVIQTFALAKTW